MIITVSGRIQRSKSMKPHYRIRLNTANVYAFMSVPPIEYSQGTRPG